MEFDIECPTCKGRFEISSKDILPDSNEICPNCKDNITFSTEDIHKAQKEINDLKKSLKSLLSY